jgi:hypothetical protein
MGKLSVISRFLSVLGLLAFTSSGCNTVVHISKRFPSPVVEPLPVDIGVYYDEDFRSYQYRSKGEKWVVPIGPASVALFNRVFTAMFERAVPVENQPSSPGRLPEFDALIQPEIKGYEFLLPAASGSDFYQVSIEYRMNLYASNGEVIDRWSITGWGWSRSKFWRAGEALAEATTVAMRDAAAAMIINFTRRRRIKDWLSQVNGRELSDNAGSSREEPLPG